MTIRHSSFTYKSRIKVSRTDLELAKAKKKKCTVRLGTLGVASDRMEFYDGERRLPIVITRVDNQRTWEEITDEDAIADGLTGKRSLEEDLRKFYGAIDPKQPMTVIFFELS